MKDEVRRILKLVQEGKLSAEDAAELIEAFEGNAAAEQAAESTGSAETPPPPPPSEGSTDHKDPLKSLVEAIEKLSREATKNIDWQKVANEAKESANKARDTIKSGFEQMKKGGFGGFGFMGGYESRVVSLPLSVPEGKILRIENPCGDVRITGGAPLGEVTADAKFRGSTEEARARAAAYTLIIEESDNSVAIKQPDVHGLSVDLDIKVPGNCPVEVRSSSGDVTVTDTRGNCRVHGKSGDVQLKGIDGQIELSGMSGDIVVEDSVASSCAVENKSGDIVLRRVSGNANVRTTSGNVEIRDCEIKSLAVDGVSGEVDVDLRTPITQAVSIRTVNGNVLVAVPDGSDCRVGLKALRGHVACAIPLQDEARAEGQVTGKLGEGKGTLDVSAVNGNITVEMHVSF